MIDASIDARAERAKVNFVELKVHFEKMHPTKEVPVPSGKKDDKGEEIFEIEHESFSLCDDIGTLMCCQRDNDATPLAK